MNLIGVLSFKFPNSGQQSASGSSAFPVENSYGFAVERVGSVIGFTYRYDAEFTEL
jgi:hypothetical protein